MGENPDRAVGLLACPLPDDASLEFQRFLEDYKFELGEAGGRTILWRPIGHPARIDDIYRNMRTAELRERDEADTIRYKRECNKHGGADHHDRLQYRRAVRLYGLQDYPRPLIFFIAAPDVGRRAVLPIDPRVFDTPEKRRQFGQLLCRSLAEERILECSDNGVFTLESLAKLQEHLNTLQTDIRAIAEPDVDLVSLPASPLLTLREIKDGKGRKSFLARIVGNGPFEGVDKKLGARQLFFIYLLFGSEEERLIDQVYRTVVTEERVIQELLKWRDCGLLRLSGPDKNKPAHRVMKMWGEFTRQFEKEPKLSGLFKRVKSKDVSPITLYTLRLRVIQTQILVANVSSLFKGMTTL